MMNLVDNYGRRIRKLRVSLTDKCNLRCHYCMPVNQSFMDESKYLNGDEIFGIVSELVDLGLEEVRLTGGEPLLRKSFPQIVERLAELKLKKLALTTNGILIDKYIDVLTNARVIHLNISLDSLNEENFKKITFGNYLGRILKNIQIAKAAGLSVKINTVMMRGVNDHELLDFVNFSKEYQVDVRFLELMRIGYAREDQVNQFIPASEMIERIKKVTELKVVTSALDSTSFNFLTSSGAQIGFIASESQPFCGHCSRWRLSADGILRACLLKDDGNDIRNTTPESRQMIYQQLLGMKPSMRPIEVSHYMNSIGG